MKQAESTKTGQENRALNNVSQYVTKANPQFERDLLHKVEVSPALLTAGDLTRLQQSVGNKATGRLLNRDSECNTIQCKPIDAHGDFTASSPENHTGLPDRLKTGLECLSGFDLAPVRVHYNSDKPYQVGALAYTKGTNIYVAPGQEKHLSHEGWHVVQQLQGRVKPAFQMKELGEGVNDDPGLEREADEMGGKAVIQKPLLNWKNSTNIQNGTIQRKQLTPGELNIAGEDHPQSEPRRVQEAEDVERFIGGNYWREQDFEMLTDDGSHQIGDPPELRLMQFVAYIRELLNFYKSGWPFQPQLGIKMRSLLEAIANIKRLHLTQNYKLLDDIKDNLDFWLANMDQLPVPPELNDIDIIDESLTLMDNNSIIELFPNEIPGDVNSSTVLLKKRSQKMYEAFEKGKQQKMVGVWKVGELHIQDMIELGKGDEVTTLAEFNQWYDLRHPQS